MALDPNNGYWRLRAAKQTASADYEVIARLSDSDQFDGRR